MLRSLGIPARFVVGYAQGEYDSQTQTYTVRKLDSHAWPEVYFIDYGWVPFEPTVSQPALILPAGSDRADGDPTTPERNAPPIMDAATEEPLTDLDVLPPADPDAFEVLPPRVEGSTIAWVMLVLFILTLIVGIGVLQRPDLFKINIDPLPVLLERALIKRGKNVPGWLHRWSYLASLSTAQRAYQRLCRSIKILGQPLDPAQTPTERAQTLINHIPQAYQPALEIVDQYHLDRFSNHIINEGQTNAAGWQVLGLALKARLGRLFENKTKL